jgi:lipopolysaccharide transport system permease protein
MNPHAAHSTSLIALVRALWANHALIMQMTRREVVGRYKGSLFGIAWSFFNPLLMLAVYTFVFSVVFKARWGIVSGESKTEFALVLFVGLIIHNLLAEVLNRAPTHILSNTNYVKKVIFPLEILTLVNLGAAIFQTLISFIVLLLVLILLNGLPSWTVVYAPLTLLPILPLILGFGWLLTALGVYMRDIGQIIGVLTSALMFLAPVFYPVTTLPEAYRSVLYLNPLTIPIEETRAVIIFGLTPNWIELGIYTAVSISVCWMGFWWFQKTRKGFADVL